MGRGISIPLPLEGYGVSDLSQLINYYLAREREFQGAKVPGSDSSWNFRSRERKFQGSKVPGSESSRERQFLELSLPGAKVPGSDSS